MYEMTMITRKAYTITSPTKDTWEKKINISFNGTTIITYKHCDLVIRGCS